MAWVRKSDFEAIRGWVLSWHDARCLRGKVGIEGVWSELFEGCFVVLWVAPMRPTDEDGPARVFLARTMGRKRAWRRLDQAAEQLAVSAASGR